MDLAPTFLAAAGLKPRPEMTGRSFFGLLTGEEKCGSRNVVFLERERHASVRAGNAGYPMRAVRTRDFLYIRNLRPERWSAGDPEIQRDPPRPFGDCDAGPTKEYILDHREEPAVQRFFHLCFDKRPAEELYDLIKDPDQLNNVAAQPEYAAARKACRAQLNQWMKNTADFRKHTTSRTSASKCATTVWAAWQRIFGLPPARRTRQIQPNTFTILWAS